ncbi:Six-hairpin glycosidase-like protein [Hyaloraphidium curvatum]|nr:Six-hairpin glycosidase-like protein [Hyaloraphidium curvatum]
MDLRPDPRVHQLLPRRIRLGPRGRRHPVQGRVDHRGPIRRGGRSGIASAAGSRFWADHGQTVRPLHPLRRILRPRIPSFLLRPRSALRPRPGGRGSRVTFRGPICHRGTRAAPGSASHRGASRTRFPPMPARSRLQTARNGRTKRCRGGGAGFARASLLAVLAACLPHFRAASAQAASPWAPLLSASLYYYEAQRAGRLPPGNRVPWRGDSALTDGQDIGVDLSGGYFDAGDHMKFSFPLGNVITSLAWGGVEFADGFERAGETTNLRAAVKWGTDWLAAAHFEPRKLAVQVGNMSVDHSRWTSHEDLPLPRPTLVIDDRRPGTDAAAQAAAALAAASMLFLPDSRGEIPPGWGPRYPKYRTRLLRHARELFDFALTAPRARYQDSVPAAGEAYASSGYDDELLYAALWLARATGRNDYAEVAGEMYDRLAVAGMAEGGGEAPVHDWNSKWGGCIVLAALVLPGLQYPRAAARYLDRLMPGRHPFTPGGMWWSDAMSNWQSLGGAGNHAFLAAVFARGVVDPGRTGNGTASPARRRAYTDFARSQARYMFGENPRNATYMVGVAGNSPKRIHHATAAGPDQYSPGPNLHTLTGAIVNGPGKSDEWADDRADYVRNEAALNTAGMWTGVLAFLCAEGGAGPAFSNSTLRGGGNVLGTYDWGQKDEQDPFGDDGTPSSAPEATSSPTPSPQPPAGTSSVLSAPPPASFSAGAIAGIVLGTLLGLALLLVCCYACYSRYRRRREWRRLGEENVDGYDWSMFAAKGGMDKELPRTSEETLVPSSAGSLGRSEAG